MSLEPMVTMRYEESYEGRKGEREGGLRNGGSDGSEALKVGTD